MKNSGRDIWPKGNKAADSTWSIGAICIWAVGMIVFYIAVNAIGKRVAPTIIHHEREHAHCYTAGKMMFVSIACVPKVK